MTSLRSSCPCRLSHGPVVLLCVVLAAAATSELRAETPSLAGTTASCEGGEVLDDGTPESYRGFASFVPSASVIQEFTPPAYPAVYLEVCVAWSRNGGDSIMAYEVVIYDDDGTGGEPGTLLVAVPALAFGVPLFPDYAFYSTRLALPAVSAGSVYIGVRYDPSADLDFFYLRDESAATPPQRLRLSTDGGATWLGVVDANALFIRAKSTDDYAIVPPEREASPSNLINERLPFGTPFSRCQQVFLGDEVGSGWIAEIRFRGAWGELGAFGPVLFSGARVALSTTARSVDDLLGDFGANVGPDEVVVFEGDLTLSSNGLPGIPAPGPKMFDVIVPLERPFNFGGSGNLLLDISLPNGSLPPTAALDAHDGIDGISRACCGDLPSCPSGNLPTSIDSTGLVTMFLFGDGLVFADGFESGQTSTSRSQSR